MKEFRRRAAIGLLTRFLFCQVLFCGMDGPTMVKAQSGNDAELTFLDAGGGPLVPAFTAAELNYTQTVPALQTELSVWPAVRDPGARVRVRVNEGPWVPVSPGTPLAGGNSHSVVLRNDGTVAAWGSNSTGQSIVPAAASQVFAVGSVAAGDADSVALKRDGSVLTWGWREVLPVPAAALTGVVAVDSGGGRVLALKQNGTLVAWGNISYDGTTIPAEAASGIVAVSAAVEHTLVLRRDGRVIAWGLNSEGKTSVPAAAQSGVIAVAAGSTHSLALKGDGSVVAWGSATYGQSVVPAAASAGVAAIAAGQFHSVALKADGSVIAWGRNDMEQTRVPASATGVTAIAAGRNHCLALKANGSVIGWGGVGLTGGSEGFPPAGLTGVGRVTAPPAAAALPLVPGVNVIEVAVTSANGTITKTWTIRTTRPGAPEIAVFNGEGTAPADERTDNAGAISFGSIRTGAQSPAQSITIQNAGTTPLAITTLNIAPGDPPVEFTVIQPPAAELQPGQFTTIQVVFAPAAAGFRSRMLQIISNDADENPFRIELSGIGVPPPSASDRLSFLAAGGESMLPAFDPQVLNYTQSGTSSDVAVWPIAAGTGALVDVRLNGGPWRPVSGGSPLAAGESHFLAVTEHGSAAAWGSNAQGQSMVPVSAGYGMAHAAAGGYHNLAIGEDNVLQAWGSGASGQTAIPPAAASGIVFAEGGFSSSFALKRDGSLIGWGFGPSGSANVPVFISDVVSVSAGYEHTLVLRRSGRVAAWGSNTNLQSTVPAEALSDIIAVSAGDYHSLALTADGRVIAWGQNAYGQTTVPPEALSGIVSIRAGSAHSLALTSGGRVLAWGAGRTVVPNDQLETGQSIVPGGALSGVTGIAAARTMSGALKADGSILTWGSAPFIDITPPAGLRSVRQTTAPPGIRLTGIKGGANLIEVRVTAQDGNSSRTYAIAALRPEISVHDGDTSEAPELSAGQSSPVDFGRIVEGSPGIRSLTIRNTGSAPLTMRSLTVPPGFAAAPAPALPLTIAPGESLVARIRLTATAVGSYQGTVTLVSDDIDESSFGFPVSAEIFIPDPVATAPEAKASLNRQTGLREHTIHITNDTTATIPAWRLIVRGVPAGIEVNNASETRPDGTVVVYIRTAMTPHSAQDVVLEYYSPDRRPADFTPLLSTEVVPEPLDLTAPAGGALPVVENVRKLNGGEVMIDFASVPGRRYQIEYSVSGGSWQASIPLIRAAANRTQWIDRGLPRTERHPRLDESRLYRVREVEP